MLGPSRRHVLRGAATLAITAGLTTSTALVPSHLASAAGKSVIYVTTLSDTNIQDLFQHTLVPDFEKAFPQYTVNYVNILHGTNAQSLIVDRMTAAMQAGKKSYNLDVVENSPLTYTYPAGKTYQDYFLPLNAKNVPNAAKIPASVLNSVTGYEMPYRASAVVLAYNSQEVPNPPKTFSGMVAWIKAHPGRFTYCPPSEGGSGGAFVQAALRSVMPAAAFSHPYNKKYEANWPKAWALLKSLEPDMFQHGFHPNGNNAVLNLLGKGTIWMATAWSDQSLSYMAQGLLPSTIKLTQITPPFDGGPATLAMPKLAQNPKGGRAFINFLLTPAEQAKIASAIQGFPAIAFKYMPANVIHHFGAIATGYNYFPPGYGADINAAWQANVPSAS
jgi:putative spermidine/putrescine transport system substrate-binding protein